MKTKHKLITAMFAGLTALALQAPTTVIAAPLGGAAISRAATTDLSPGPVTQIGRRHHHHHYHHHHHRHHYHYRRHYRPYYYGYYGVRRHHHHYRRVRIHIHF